MCTFREKLHFGAHPIRFVFLLAIAFPLQGIYADDKQDDLLNEKSGPNSRVVKPVADKRAGFEDSLRAELDAAKQNYGYNSPQVLKVLQKLADHLYKDEKRYKDRLEVLKQTVSVSRAVYGDQHHIVGQQLTRYGIALADARQYKKAYKIINLALANIKIHNKISTRDLLKLRDALAKVYLGSNSTAAGFQLLEKNLVIRKQVYGENSLEFIYNLRLIGKYYEREKSYKKALPYFLKGLSINEKKIPKNYTHIAVSLDDVAEMYRAMGKYLQAEPYYLRSFRIFENEKPVNYRNLSIAQNNLASLYMETGRYPDALHYYKLSLVTTEKAFSANSFSMATSLSNLASLQHKMGYDQQALINLKKALHILEGKLPGGHIKLATIYGNLAVIYDELDEHRKAIMMAEKSLAIRQRLLSPMHSSVAISLYNLANYYEELNQYIKASELARRSIVIFEKHYPDGHPNLASSLAFLGRIYRETGKYREALTLYQRSLEMRKKILPPNHPDIARSLHSLAFFYRFMGQYKKALEFDRRSFAILEKSLPAGHPILAGSMNSMANILRDMHQYQQALQLYEKALEINRKHYKPDHTAIGDSYNSLALLYSSMGNYQKALEYYKRSYAIWEKRYGADSIHLATSFNNLGTVQFRLKNYPQAIDDFHKALLLLSSSIGYKGLLSTTQNNLKYMYKKLGQMDLAILWGKEAVNTIQGMRTGLKGLDENLQKGFLQKRRHIYQDLADMLIQQGRIQEAQVVLQMLKEDELHNTLKRSSNIDPRTTQIELNGLEHRSFAQYYQLREQQTRLARERENLLRKQKLAEITRAESNRLEEINTKLLPPLRQAMQVFLQTLQKNLSQYASEKAYRKRDASLKLVQTNLQKALGSAHVANPDAKVVAVQYVVTDERLSILLSTSDAPPLARQLPFDTKGLRKMVLSVREHLSNPRSDRKLLMRELQQLHKLLIEPIAIDLKNYGADTLVLVPNDVLRYVPFAALYDGKRYLVQDYTLTLFNEAVKKDFTTRESDSWKLVAMGLTRAVEDLPALPSVREEVTAITTRVGLVGTAYLDDQFTRPVLYNSLKQHYNVLHLASHFVFVPGRPDASRIFLGDRSPLSLGDIARANLRFDPFSLVTFSACESGLGGGLSADGRDMESLGALVQTQGARAVIATLWKVEDSSTATLMENFYRSHEEEQLTKAQALRQAQLGFIKRGEESVLAHPYYWAPFVLMGDWR